MNIVFDVDGVLADFSRGFCGVLKDMYGLDLDPRACKSWHWWEWVDGLTKEMEDTAWGAIFDDPKYATFWRDLQPLVTPREVERINDLSQRNLVSFVTNRSAVGQHANVVNVTRGWLAHEGFRSGANTYLAGSGQKGRRSKLLGAHIAIEDNGDNCIDFLDAGVAVAILRRPYNEGFVELVKARGGYAVDTLEEFLDILARFDVQQDDMLAMNDQVRAQNALWNQPAPAVE